jgi:FTR1 family protein
LLQAFIITLREGVEAALIIGITLAYLNKIQRPDLRRAVFFALGSAFAASIGVAVLLSRFQFNEDLFEGWVMLAAAFFVVTMIVFMMRTGKKLKGEIEGKIGLLASRGSQAGIFLFVFLMVLREGAETVLILSAVSLNSSALMSFLGTLFGVLAAVIFGVMFVKGSVRINLQKFFRVTNDFFFFVTILALAGLMVLFEARRRQPVAVPESGAEKRKALWTANRERLWMVSVYATSFLFIVLITAEFIYAKDASTLSAATPVSFSNGAVSIPLANVSDGDLHRYAVTIGGTPMRFLLYQKPDGKVAVVFDACEICGSVGFFKTQNGLVCKNCASPINSQSVGTPGGCNPVPVRSTVNDGVIVIQEADLGAGARLFKR